MENLILGFLTGGSLILAIGPQNLFVIEQGLKRNYYLNKLTHFDLREKKFPVSTMAQTLIAKIDCSIYHLKDKYLITCNSSFEDYFRERLLDSVNV